MINLEINWEDVKTFYNFLEPEEDTLVYQIFYQDGGSSQQQHVKNHREVKGELVEHKGQGINCLSINPREEGETGTESVTKLRTIFVDIDVKSKFKEYGVAPLEYKEKAEELSEKVAEYLEEEHGLKYQIKADSGNGYHLYIPVHFKPNFNWKDSKIVEKLQDLNKDLERFDTEHVEVDSITKDVARRVKIPGTHNLKEDMKEESEIRKASIEAQRGEVSREDNTDNLVSLEVETQQQANTPNPSNQETVKNTNKDDSFDKLEVARQIDDKLDELMSGRDIKNDRSWSEAILMMKAIYWGFNPESLIKQAGIGKYDEVKQNGDVDKYIDSQMESISGEVKDRFDWDEYRSNMRKAVSNADKDLENLEEAIEDQEERRTKDGFVMPNKYFQRNKAGNLVKDGKGNLIEKKSTIKNDYAREFAEWIAREKKQLVYVVYDIEKEEGSLWKYNAKKQTWNTGGGGDFLNTKIYENLPKKHSESTLREAKLKVQAINSINFEETQTKAGKIAVENGILDVDTKDLRDIKREDYIYKKINASYKPDAGMPKNLIQFLDESVSESDKKKIQEYLGYSLLDTTKYKKLLITVGPQNSGKSVLLKGVEEFIGKDNVASQKLEDLANDPYSRANLLGNKVNIRNDLDGDEIKKPGTIKELASGDTMDREEKFVQRTQFEPQQKHWYACNETPSISTDKDEDSFYDKFLTVTFPKEVPKEDRIDRDKLVNKLAGEEENDKILNWALEGLERLEEQGYFTNQLSTYEVQEKWKEYGNSAERFTSKYLVTRKQKLEEYKQEIRQQNLSEDDKLQISEEEVKERAKERVKQHMWKIHTDMIEKMYKLYTNGMGLEEKGIKKLVKEIKAKPGVKKGKPTIHRGENATKQRRRGFMNIKLVDDANKKIKQAIENKATASRL